MFHNPFILERGDHMNIVLYSTNSPKNALDKTLTQVASITGESNESIGKVNTSFTLSKNYINDVKNSNYLYSDVTGKYYFIENYEIKNQTVKINAKQDVLSNYKVSIRSNTCTVSRNANIANAYLYDNGYQLKTYNIVSTKLFPRGLTDNSIILMTIG